MRAICVCVCVYFIICFNAYVCDAHSEIHRTLTYSHFRRACRHRARDLAQYVHMSSPPTTFVFGILENKLMLARAFAGNDDPSMGRWDTKEGEAHKSHMVCTVFIIIWNYLLRIHFHICDDDKSSFNMWIKFVRRNVCLFTLYMLLCTRRTIKFSANYFSQRVEIAHFVYEAKFGTNINL